jgi:tRNA dimethylallyltransferase
MVGIDRELDDLRVRIAARYEAQMEAGLLDEVRRLHDDPRGLSRSARQALGYKELLEHVEGHLALEDALDLAIRRTGRFARRQRAWFRRDPRIRWVAAQGATATDDLVTDVLAAL